MPNYPTDSDLKSATGINTSKFAKKVDLGGLKSGINELHIDELKKVPSGLKS